MDTAKEREPESESVEAANRLLKAELAPDTESAQRLAKDIESLFTSESKTHFRSFCFDLESHKNLSGRINKIFRGVVVTDPEKALETYTEILRSETRGLDRTKLQALNQMEALYEQFPDEVVQLLDEIIGDDSEENGMRIRAWSEYKDIADSHPEIPMEEVFKRYELLHS